MRWFPFFQHVTWSFNSIKTNYYILYIDMFHAEKWINNMVQESSINHKKRRILPCRFSCPNLLNASARSSRISKCRLLGSWKLGKIGGMRRAQWGWLVLPSLKLTARRARKSPSKWWILQPAMLVYRRVVGIGEGGWDDVRCLPLYYYLGIWSNLIQVVQVVE